MTRYMIFGYSDDLVELREFRNDPDIHIHADEFGGYGSSEEQPIILEFSDGSVVRAWYDNHGVWRMTGEKGNLSDSTIVVVPFESDDEIYTDILFITGIVELERVTFKGECLFPAVD